MVAGFLRNSISLLLTLLLLAGAATTSSAGAQSATPAPEAQLLADGAYYPILLGKIRAAGKSIDLVMYLWKTSGTGGSKPAELIQALGDARRRGVAVRVILENSGYDEGLNQANRDAAGLLQRQGITAIFDSPTVTTHAKLAVIDRRYCFLGSHNLTHSALSRNHELSVLFDSPRLAEELSSYVAKLLEKR